MSETTPPAPDPPGSDYPLGDAAPRSVLTGLGRALTAPTLKDGATTLLDVLQGSLGVSGGLVVLRVGDSVRVLASRGFPAGWIASWEASSPGDALSLLAAELVHEPLEAPPGLIDSVLKRSDVRALLTLPLGRPEDPDGAVVLASPSESPFPEIDRGQLEGVAAAFGAWLQTKLLRGEGTALPSVRPAASSGTSHEAAERHATWGSIPFARIDTDGSILEAAAGFARLFRLRNREAGGQSPREYLAAADVPRFQEALDHAQVEGTVALPAVRPAAGAEPSGAKYAIDLVLSRRDADLLAFAFPSTVGVYVGHDADLGDALAQQSDLAIVRIGGEGKILTWPSRARRVLGWAEDEMRGRSVELLFSADDRAEWERRRRSRGAKGSGEWQLSLRSRDGHAVPCAVRLLHLDETEEMFFILRDHRGGEASEKWLRWSRALLSVLGVSTLVLDPGGRIRELGAGWVTGTDRRLADWLGRHVADLFESDRSEVLAALRTAARENEWTGSFLANGLQVPLRLKAVRGAEGNLEAIVGARLPEIPGEARELFRKIPVGMILVDNELKIMETNPELRAICGDTVLPSSPVGVDVRSLSVFQTREAQQALDGLPERKRLDLPEIVLKGPSREPVVVQMRADELTDDSGATTGYVLMLLKRRGWSQMEKQLIRAQKMESIGNFASGLAHDFGSFVSVILGKAGVLRVKLPDDRHIVRELEDIETAAKRAQHLAQGLMKFARGGRNRVATMEINRLIEAVSSLIRTSVGKKIDVGYRLDESVCAVEGDEVELQQLVLNLCLNARDAMPDGGRLTLETRPLTPEQVARLDTGEGVGEGVCLIVRDTGTGMPPEVAERVFEPFFSTKDDSSGTGLGLAMVYGIVRRHGGTIDVHSTPGVGTAFEIALPAATGPAPSGGHRILVVDDEPAFREMIRLILEEDGHQAVLAANGIEALKILRTDTSDLGLVILDLRMPGVDGLSVLDELREMAPELPVLVATGYASDDEKQRALDAGARRILEKPYRVMDLRGALAEILDPPAPEGEPAPDAPIGRQDAPEAPLGPSGSGPA